jgi:hypothetical protein
MWKAVSASTGTQLSSTVIPASLAGLLSVLSFRSRILGWKEADVQLFEAKILGGRRKLVFYYLLEDSLCMLVVARKLGDRFGGDFVSVCGSTIVGRGMRVVLRQLGRRSLPLTLSSKIPSLRDVQLLVRERAPITLSADGLGEAGRVTEGLARLVRARGAIAYPVAVRAAWSLPGSTRLHVPLPGSKIGVVIGAPVSGMGDDLTIQRLDTALRDARASAAQLLSQI